MLSLPKRDDCNHYASCYCEENIYWFYKQFRQELPNAYVVFVSNSVKKVQLHCQTKGNQSSGGGITWDYHVVCVCKLQGALRVFDFDSTLEWGIPFKKYMEATFLNKAQQPKPGFRVVSGEQYAQVFCSDRSHMRKEDGTWQQGQPDWPPIQQPEVTSTALHQGASNNLPNFTGIPDRRNLARDGFFGDQQQAARSNKYGVVLQLQEFKTFAACEEVEEKTSLC